MGFLSSIFGSGKNDICDVETEYKGFLDSTECLARVGAEFGKYEFFMHVQCEGKCIYITIELDFLNQLKFVQNGPHFLDAKLKGMGITHSEYDFFMKNIHVENKDEMHDIGKAKIIQEFKNPKCSKAVFDVLKSRLVNIKNTTHRVDEYTISLHDE